jgi:hypothetical protein
MTKLVSKKVATKVASKIVAKAQTAPKGKVVAKVAKKTKATKVAKVAKAPKVKSTWADRKVRAPSDANETDIKKMTSYRCTLAFNALVPTAQKAKIETVEYSGGKVIVSVKKSRNLKSNDKNPTEVAREIVANLVAAIKKAKVALPKSY